MFGLVHLSPFLLFLCQGWEFSGPVFFKDTTIFYYETQVWNLYSGSLLSYRKVAVRPVKKCSDGFLTN